MFEYFRHSRIILFLSIAFATLFLIILSSKNQLIIYCILVPILFFQVSSKGAFKKIAIASLILASIVFLMWQNDQVKYRFINEVGSAESHRLGIWKSAYELGTENLVTGVGIGDRSEELQEKFVDKGLSDLSGYNSAHNVFLDFLMSFGCFGVIILLLVLAAPLLVADRNRLMIIFVFIVATAGLTESILLRQKGATFFLLFYGVLGSGISLPFTKSKPE